MTMELRVTEVGNHWAAERLQTFRVSLWPDSYWLHSERVLLERTVPAATYSSYRSSNLLEPTFPVTTCLNVPFHQQPAWTYRSSNNLLEPTVPATTCWHRGKNPLSVSLCLKRRPKARTLAEPVSISLGVFVVCRPRYCRIHQLQQIFIHCSTAKYCQDW